MGLFGFGKKKEQAKVAEKILGLVNAITFSDGYYIPDNTEKYISLKFDNHKITISKHGESSQTFSYTLDSFANGSSCITVSYGNGFASQFNIRAIDDKTIMFDDVRFVRK